MDKAISHICEDFLEKLKDPGCQESWREFHRLYHGFIQMVIYKMVKNHEDAKDLSQEVNIHIWRKICLYNSESSMFTTWLSRVIRNKVLDLLKQQKKKEIQGVERCLLELWGEDYFDCKFQNEWQKHILKLSRDKVQIT